MTGIYIIAVLLIGQVSAEIVELSCTDNATCINNLGRQLYSSIKQRKTVRLFDLITIEPIRTRESRSYKGPLTRLLTSHAISFDWNDFTFRLSNPEDKEESMDLEVFENRSSKDEPETVPKKTSIKAEDESEDKLPKSRIKRKRPKKKVLQAVIPLLFGMKSTGAILFAMAMVTAITMKAFFASKLALLVTIGMAMKKLYESYSNGIGLPNNPYLYSQYPIDFPSASSQAYSVNGVNSQFASPDIYNPTAVGSQSHSHEIHPNEVTAQHSQQAPTLLLNSTRSASERWDGKSKLLKFLEPILGSVRNVFEPLANVFYAMPATFRGLNSDVTTVSSETNVDDNNVKEFLIPQPRHIAQRKMNYRIAPRTKKYTELKVNLDRLRQNKDLPDYIKTKKYKYNYPLTYYYPRVKYFVNPNIFTSKPNNSRLSQYRKETMRKNETVLENDNNFFTESTDWKPIIMPTTNATLKVNDKNNKVKKANKKNKRRKSNRYKRDIKNNNLVPTLYEDTGLENDKKMFDFSRGFLSIFGGGLFEFIIDPMSVIFKHAGEITKDLIESSTKKKKPPQYYSIAYNTVMYSLDAIAGMFDVTNILKEQYLEDITKKKNKSKSKIKSKNKKKKPIIKITSKF